MEERYKIASELDENALKLMALQIKEEMDKTVDFSDIVKSQRGLFDDFKKTLEGIVNERKK